MRGVGTSPNVWVRTMRAMHATRDLPLEGRDEDIEAVQDSFRLAEIWAISVEGEGADHSGRAPSVAPI